jgi:hypothetical protein
MVVVTPGLNSSLRECGDSSDRYTSCVAVLWCCVLCAVCCVLCVLSMEALALGAGDGTQFNDTAPQSRIMLFACTISRH